MSKEKIEKINEKSAEVLLEWMKKMGENDSFEEIEDDMLANVYALMIVASFFGYSLEKLAEDAIAARKKLDDMVAEDNID